MCDVVPKSANASEGTRPSRFEVEKILDGGWDAMQRAKFLTTHERLLGLTSAAVCLVERDIDERVEARVPTLNPLDESVDNLNGGEVAATDPESEFACASLGQFVVKRHSAPP